MAQSISPYAESIAYSEITKANRVFFIIKRTTDLTIAVLSIPLLVILAIIIKIAYLISGDRASIFHKQIRIGKEGTEFVIYKFRTMVRNSEEILNDLLEDPKRKQEWELSHKLENDPRITRIGRILRKSSIDEIPQIINILKGEMSLIGPRPITRVEVDAYQEQQFKLLSIRPGLTGWWACHGRSCTSEERRRELELYYCDHLSILLDLKCLALTIIKVITQEGAK